MTEEVANKVLKAIGQVWDSSYCSRDPELQHADIVGAIANLIDRPLRATSESFLGWCVRPDEVNEFWVVLGRESSKSLITHKKPDPKITEMSWCDLLGPFKTYTEACNKVGLYWLSIADSWKPKE